MRTFLYIFLSFTTLPLTAQEDSLVLLDKSFVFQNGVYKTYEAFRQNEPDIAWKEVEANWVTNPQTLMTQVEFLRMKRKLFVFCRRGCVFSAISSSVFATDLLEAYNDALKSDPTYLAAKSTYEAALQDVPITRSVLLPQLFLQNTNNGSVFMSKAHHSVLQTLRTHFLVVGTGWSCR
ncbi:MAG: hypothetical protein LRY43_01000 [Gammaproteobacteria bacterium]|nr:hypothetical protein [Gammaproteobacteria bacterium]